MFRNYLIVALRNLWRHSFHAFLNIFGLALGTTCCLLVFLFLQFEWSHDRFHKNADDIYRLLVRRITPDGDTQLSCLHQPSIVKPLKEEHVVVSHVSGYMKSSISVTVANETFDVEAAIVNGDFLRLFTFPFVAGDRLTALDDPSAAVLSEKAVRLLFGLDAANEDLIGSSLEIATHIGEVPLTLTGIVEDVPENSSLRFDMLISEANFDRFSWSNDVNGIAEVFVGLSPGYSRADLEESLPGFAERHLIDGIARWKDIWHAGDMENSYQLKLQSLLDIYLNESLTGPLDFVYTRHGDYRQGYLLGVVSLLVLALACVNFVSLSLSLSVERSAEVGVRQVLGSTRRQLMCQFWGEALVVGALSLAVGIGMAEFLLPTFSDLVQRPLSFVYLDFGQTTLLVFFVLLAIGLVAGSSPALFLSGASPVTALAARSRQHRSLLTKTLVVLQYAASVAFLVGTTIVFQQARYMQERNLGYQKTNMVVIHSPSSSLTETFMNRVSSLHDIKAVAASDQSFTSGLSSWSYQREDGAYVDVRIIKIEPNYLEALDIDLLEGRDFSTAFAADSEKAVIVNETLVQRFGWDNPLGQVLRSTGQGSLTHPVVIGVVKDFHYESLHSEIHPLALHVHPGGNQLSKIFVRIREESAASTLAQLRRIWTEIAPDAEFEYAFLEDNLNNQYRAERNWIRILGYTAVLALMITCMGLIGQLSLSVVKRTKEIGIRKVLGATAVNVVGLLSKDFLLLAIGAIAVSWPLTYIAFSKWLGNYPYRIEIGSGAFLLSAAVALAVGWLSVSYVAIRASTRNPADALRYE